MSHVGSKLGIVSLQPLNAESQLLQPLRILLPRNCCIAGMRGTRLSHLLTVSLHIRSQQGAHFRLQLLDGREEGTTHLGCHLHRGPLKCGGEGALKFFLEGRADGFDGQGGYCGAASSCGGGSSSSGSRRI